jgi:hypothetical protein
MGLPTATSISIDRLLVYTVVSLEHVVEVTENSRVFVKSMEVHHCKNLAEHTITPTSQFRGRLDVTRERAYTRQRLLHDELAKPFSFHQFKSGYTQTESPL